MAPSALLSLKELAGNTTSLEAGEMVDSDSSRNAEIEAVGLKAFQ